MVQIKSGSDRAKSGGRPVNVNDVGRTSSVDFRTSRTRQATNTGVSTESWLCDELLEVKTPSPSQKHESEQGASTGAFSDGGAAVLVLQQPHPDSTCDGAAV